MQGPSAPTPHGERVIGTLRREALDHLLTWNETRARRVLDEYARNHNGHRPRQARGRLPPLDERRPAPVTDLSTTRLLRSRVLGDLISEYRYVADQQRRISERHRSRPV
ncbi:integrase core domain-containing protein [Streptomyces hirsutus]|uniref:hypothetical protein n=1 Tax=Streptomyces hirsutus TaxID=35620 RepID=UPI003649ABAD